MQLISSLKQVSVFSALFLLTARACASPIIVTELETAFVTADPTTVTQIVETEIISSETVQRVVTDQVTVTVTGTVFSTLELSGRVTSDPLINQSILSATTSLSELDTSPTLVTSESSYSDSSFSIVPSTSSTSFSSSSTLFGVSNSTWSSTSVATLATFAPSSTDSMEFSISASTDESTALATGSFDMFEAISTAAPKSMFTRCTHPQQPLSVSDKIISDDTIPTNNFYSNLMMDDQDQPAYPYPYSVWWNRGTSGTYGLGISQTSRSQFTYGPDADDTPVEYFISPSGIQSIAFGATEFDSSMTMALSALEAMSVNITMAPGSGDGSLTIPLVQGAGFLTGIYNGLTPRFDCQVGINNLTKSTAPKSGVVKYVVGLGDGTTWGIYAATTGDFSLKLLNSTSIIATNSVSGVAIQIAKIVDNYESNIDDHAGMYATGVTLSGSATSSIGIVKLAWTSVGSNNAGKLLLWALPHHTKLFPSSMEPIGFTMDCLTKGKATAYSTSSFIFEAELPDIGFEPWSSITGAEANYTSEALGLITKAAVSEVQQDMVEMSNLDSMYGAGKILDKFATICYVAHDILGNTAVTKYCLTQIKEAYARFSENNQTYPLYYDTTYKGLISSGGLGNDSLVDYGNSYYNDHHFHYGYHIHAAALIGYVDAQLGGTWADDNKEYVNSLIRDVANPSSKDTHFPVFRSFSWYHGHSWAKGLFLTADGKDQESSSEDYHHAYAIKLWGNVIGDSGMEARGAMMLAVMQASMQDYILMTDDNDIMPSNFIGNKAVGIIFENKADHTTYFGTETQYIQGIHMIPITPVSSYIRTPTFVEQEWNEILESIIDDVTDGWKGILMANLGLTDPATAWDFFTSSNFTSDYLDGGASLTWYLTYLAGVGGASS
ncbi:glycosyl hydrolase family 81-domain-containing protein [Lipomyces oligophaga]|uniref:glycosyl hydrolase family 81-domain-containing protein n=1 Tax=Lipomyces oligophaga TaxID=45792 RepID=UPI0034CD222B